jgi:hypothetical protein
VKGVAQPAVAVDRCSWAAVKLSLGGIRLAVRVVGGTSVQADVPWPFKPGSRPWVDRRSLFARSRRALFIGAIFVSNNFASGHLQVKGGDLRRSCVR